MNNKIIYAFLGVFAIVTGASQVFAWCITPSCHLEEAMKDLESGKKSTNLENYCRKGEASTLTFSVRSFNGLACEKYATQAAGYLALCSKVLDKEDFEKAQCFEKAIKKLGIDKPTDDESFKKMQEKAVEELKAGLERGQDKALGAMKKLTCAVLGDQPVISMMCPKKEEASKE